MPLEANASMFGVLAFESLYAEKNKDWSSHTNQSMFFFSCELKLIVTKNNIVNKVFFLNNINLYQFFFVKFIESVI